MTVTTTPAYATGAQANFILTLQGMPKDDDNRAEAALAICETMSKAEASKLITELKATKPKPAAIAKGEWHCLGGKFYLVAQSQSTGNMYAKERLSTGFAFAPGVMFKLSGATKVSVEHLSHIQNFGKLTNRCVFCYLPLDQPESITAGYGKKCSENQGLPWGN